MIQFLLFCLALSAFKDERKGLGSMYNVMHGDIHVVENRRLAKRLANIIEYGNADPSINKPLKEESKINTQNYDLIPVTSSSNGHEYGLQREVLHKGCSAGSVEGISTPAPDTTTTSPNGDLLETSTPGDGSETSTGVPMSLGRIQTTGSYVRQIIDRYRLSHDPLNYKQLKLKYYNYIPFIFEPVVEEKRSKGSPQDILVNSEEDSFNKYEFSRRDNKAVSNNGNDYMDTGNDITGVFPLFPLFGNEIPKEEIETKRRRKLDSSLGRGHSRVYFKNGSYINVGNLYKSDRTPPVMLRRRLPRFPVPSYWELLEKYRKIGKTLERDDENTKNDVTAAEHYRRYENEPPLFQGSSFPLESNYENIQEPKELEANLFQSILSGSMYNPNASRFKYKRLSHNQHKTLFGKNITAPSMSNTSHSLLDGRHNLSVDNLASGRHLKDVQGTPVASKPIVVTSSFKIQAVDSDNYSYDGKIIRKITNKYDNLIPNNLKTTKKANDENLKGNGTNNTDDLSVTSLFSSVDYRKPYKINNDINFEETIAEISTETILSKQQLLLHKNMEEEDNRIMFRINLFDNKTKAEDKIDIPTLKIDADYKNDVSMIMTSENNGSILRNGSSYQPNLIHTTTKVEEVRNEQRFNFSGEDDVTQEIYAKNKIHVDEETVTVKPIFSLFSEDLTNQTMENSTEVSNTAIQLTSKTERPLNQKHSFKNETTTNKAFHKQITTDQNIIFRILTTTATPAASKVTPKLTNFDVTTPRNIPKGKTPKRKNDATKFSKNKSRKSDNPKKLHPSTLRPQAFSSFNTKRNDANKTPKDLKRVTDEVETYNRKLSPILNLHSLKNSVSNYIRNTKFNLKNARTQQKWRPY